ncbi:MAG: radical SAM protein [Chitinispirillaceae bacterium]
MEYKYIFGPVRSRRLGISLGVDMVQFKTCTLDCIYCECGATTQLTRERKEYAPAEDVISELDNYLSQNPKLDFVTFGGSGEPTLNSGLGQIVSYLKKNHPERKLALLTNSTFFHIPEVRKEVIPCDLILPSLDAVSDDVFDKINRPAAHVECAVLIEGLASLSREMKGQMWLEVFIVPGVNDTDEELKKFKDAVTRINPTRVQLNSLDRPGTCSWLTPATPQELSEIASRFQPLPVEIISRNLPETPLEALSDKESTLLSLLKRRPSTLEDLSVSIGTTINNVQKMISSLKPEAGITTKEVEGRIYFCVNSK